MILFNERPSFEEAWNFSEFRVLMGGMGDDTAMMIAECYKRGFEPDEIIFCDTGSEFPHTYRFVEFLFRWCADRNWSKVTVLKKLDRFGQPLKLIEMVETQKTLPAAAFGSKSCSLRFKIETVDKYLNNHPRAHSAWGVKRKGAPLDSHTGYVLKAVGINADEDSRAAKWKPEHKWVQCFPLYDWEIGEKESDAVAEVGLYYPGKSSCIMCPHLTGAELYMLATEYPELFARVVDIEINYQKHQMTEGSSTKGLCRSKTIADKLGDFLSGKEKFDSFSQSKCSSCGS